MKRIYITRDTVLAALANHIGLERAVHARALVTEINERPEPLDAQLRSLRCIIVGLRAEGYHICGHPSSGYYMAATASEVDHTCNWLYARSMTTLQQVAAMKRVSLPDLRGQLRLPE